MVSNHLNWAHNYLLPDGRAFLTGQRPPSTTFVITGMGQPNGGSSSSVLAQINSTLSQIVTGSGTAPINASQGNGNSFPDTPPHPSPPSQPFAQSNVLPNTATEVGIEHEVIKTTFVDAFQDNRNTLPGSSSHTTPPTQPSAPSYALPNTTTVPSTGHGIVRTTSNSTVPMPSSSHFGVIVPSSQCRNSGQTNLQSQALNQSSVSPYTPATVNTRQGNGSVPAVISEQANSLPTLSDSPSRISPSSPPGPSPPIQQFHGPSQLGIQPNTTTDVNTIEGDEDLRSFSLDLSVTPETSPAPGSSSEQVVPKGSDSGSGRSVLSHDSVAPLSATALSDPVVPNNSNSDSGRLVISHNSDAALSATHSSHSVVFNHLDSDSRRSETPHYSGSQEAEATPSATLSSPSADFNDSGSRRSPTPFPPPLPPPTRTLRKRGDDGKALPKPKAPPGSEMPRHACERCWSRAVWVPSDCSAAHDGGKLPCQQCMDGLPPEDWKTCELKLHSDAESSEKDSGSKAKKKPPKRQGDPEMEDDSPAKKQPNGHSKKSKNNGHLKTGSIKTFQGHLSSAGEHWDGDEIPKVQCQETTIRHGSWIKQTDREGFSLERSLITPSPIASFRQCNPLVKPLALRLELFEYIVRDSQGYAACPAITKSSIHVSQKRPGVVDPCLEPPPTDPRRRECVPFFQIQFAHVFIRSKSPETILTRLFDSTGSGPPTLAPSVEQAYRRKCQQLKTRLNEVEEANDASRARLARLHRAINKMRLERTFLLEQVAKRTSTNVEDSEGSPSPPPTPKEKPLRIKRGHRKPSFLTSNEGHPGGSFIQQGPVTLSPSGSDAFSHTHPDAHVPATFSSLPPKRLLQNTNGFFATNSATPHIFKPTSAFELFSNDLRAHSTGQNRQSDAEGAFDSNRAIVEQWQAMDEIQKSEYQRKYENLQNGEKDADKGVIPKDEDVEMGEGETERDDGTEGGGFTAVNRG